MRERLPERSRVDPGDAAKARARIAAMLFACSHLTLATADVPRMTRFFEFAFEQKPYFENDMFSEFVLASRFRIAFFKPVGASAKSFRADAARDGVATGLT